MNALLHARARVPTEPLASVHGKPQSLGEVYMGEVFSVALYDAQHSLIDRPLSWQCPAGLEPVEAPITFRAQLRVVAAAAASPQELAFSCPQALTIADAHAALAWKLAGNS